MTPSFSSVANCEGCLNGLGFMFFSPSWRAVFMSRLHRIPIKGLLFWGNPYLSTYPWYMAHGGCVWAASGVSRVGPPNLQAKWVLEMFGWTHTGVCRACVYIYIYTQNMHICMHIIACIEDRRKSRPHTIGEANNSKWACTGILNVLLQDPRSLITPNTLKACSSATFRIMLYAGTELSTL